MNSFGQIHTRACCKRHLCAVPEISSGPRLGLGADGAEAGQSRLSRRRRIGRLSNEVFGRWPSLAFAQIAWRLSMGVHCAIANAWSIRLRARLSSAAQRLLKAVNTTYAATSSNRSHREAVEWNHDPCISWPCPFEASHRSDYQAVGFSLH